MEKNSNGSINTEIIKSFNVLSGLKGKHLDSYRTAQHRAGRSGNRMASQEQHPAAHSGSGGLGRPLRCSMCNKLLGLLVHGGALNSMSLGLILVQWRA